MLLNKIRLIARHQGISKYFFNTSWMLLEQVLRLLAGVLVGIYVARHLGPIQFGTFSYAGAFVALFSSIAKLGLDGIVVRELVNHPDHRNEILGTAFWLKVVAGFSAIGIIIGILPWTSNDYETNLYILIIASGLIFQSIEIVDFYFQSTTQAKYVAICKTIQLAISSVVKLYLIWIDADLLWFVTVALFDQVTLGLALLFIFYAKGDLSALSHFSKDTASSLLKYSWPLIISSLATILYMRIDQIMIKEMLGAENVGFYSAALRLSETVYVIPMIICTSLFPAIISAKNVSQEMFDRRILILFEIMALLSILIAIPMSLFADVFITLLFGKAYLLATDVLVIHVWGGTFVFLGVAASKWMLAENITKHTMYRTLAGAGLNIALNLFLIPIYGIRGAAIATLITYFTTSVLMNYINFKTRRCFWLQIRAMLIPGSTLISIFRKT